MFVIGAIGSFFGLLVGTALMIVLGIVFRPAVFRAKYNGMAAWFTVDRLDANNSDELFRKARNKFLNKWVEVPWRDEDKMEYTRII